MSDLSSTGNAFHDGMVFVVIKTRMRVEISDTTERIVRP